MSGVPDVRATEAGFREIRQALQQINLAFYTPPLHNWTADRNWTVTDDRTQGYSQGSWWYNATGGSGDRYHLFLCTDASPNAAVWEDVTAAGAIGGGLVNYGDLTADATARGIVCGQESTNLIDESTTIVMPDGSDGDLRFTDDVNAGFGDSDDMKIRWDSSTSRGRIEMTSDTPLVIDSTGIMYPPWGTLAQRPGSPPANGALRWNNDASWKYFETYIDAAWVPLVHYAAIGSKVGILKGIETATGTYYSTIDRVESWQADTSDNLNALDDIELQFGTGVDANMQWYTGGTKDVLAIGLDQVAVDGSEAMLVIGHNSTLNGTLDVTAPTAADEPELRVYDSTGLNYVALVQNQLTANKIVYYDGNVLTSTALGSTIALDDLSDVVITTPAKGSLLVHNGSEWVDFDVGIDNQFLRSDSTAAEGVDWYLPLIFQYVWGDSGTIQADTWNDVLTIAGGTGISTVGSDASDTLTINWSAALDDLSDVVITAVADNEVLAYDSGGNWINQTAAEAGLATTSHASTHETGGSDLVNHDSLTGFVADEHIAHSGVTLTAGDGLSGGGTIAASRSFAVNVDDSTIEISTDTLQVKDAGITYAKVQNVTDQRLLGRDSGTAGPPEEISIGGGLGIVGKAIYRAALTGDVTAIAGNSVTTVESLQGTTLTLATPAQGDYLRVDAAPAFVNVGISQILTDLLTVDGTGSSLDADLLDGNEASAFVLKSLFDANTILYATSDDTPAALTVAANSLVGRAADNIDSLIYTDVTEEASPASGDWLLGWLDTGELRKFDVGNLPGGGGGEANTASNLGAGVGVYETKSGVDLRFNSLVGATGITISEDDPNDEIDIAVAFGDDEELAFGASTDAGISWETSTANDYLAIGTVVGAAATSGYISIMEKADIGAANRDPGGTATDPTLRIYSADAAQIDDYLELYHNQTNAVVDWGNGDLVLNGHVNLPDDYLLRFGQFGGSDAAISWNVGATNSYLFIGVEVGSAAQSGYICIGETGEGDACEPSGTASTPTIRFWDTSHFADDWMDVYRDASHGHIEVGSGDLQIDGGGLDVTAGGLTVNGDIQAEAMLAYDGVVTVTPGSTATVDWNSGNVQSLTLGNNPTAIAFTDPSPATVCFLHLKVIQNASGGYVVNFSHVDRWIDGGTEAECTTTASAHDWYHFIFDGSIYYGWHSPNFA